MTELAPGSVFAGRYRLQHVLGDGGYGRVFEAEDLEVGRRVAIKVMRPDASTGYTAEKRERFRREAATVANLRDPHTVTLFDHGETQDGLLYMVFEFVDGTPLNVLLRKGPLEPDAATRIVKQVAHSLREAHRAGVLHRDLKPENIIVYAYADERHKAKLVDFGLAKATTATAHTEAPLTQSGLVMGTAAYVSPEAYLLKPVGPPHDIFGLGMVYFEMVVGYAANRAGSAMEIATLMVAPGEFVVPVSVPEPIRSIIGRMIVKNPMHRYQAIEELLRDLPETTHSGFGSQRELSADDFNGANLEFGDATQPSMPALSRDMLNQDMLPRDSSPTMLEGQRHAEPFDPLSAPQPATLIQPHLQQEPLPPKHANSTAHNTRRRTGGVIGFTVGLVVLLLVVSVALIQALGIRMPWDPKPPSAPEEMPPKVFDLRSADTAYFYVDWVSGIMLADNPAEVPAASRCALILDSRSSPSPGGVYYIIDAVEPVPAEVTAHAVGADGLAEVAGRCNTAARVADSVLLSSEIFAAERRIESVERRNEVRSKRRREARRVEADRGVPSTQDLSKLLNDAGGMKMIQQLLGATKKKGE